MDNVMGGIGGWPVALAIHVALALLCLWPAIRLLRRAGLPTVWVAWLIVPVLGWPVFASLLAFRSWPNMPPRPEKLHPREKLRRERAAADARKG